MHIFIDESGPFGRIGQFPSVSLIGALIVLDARLPSLEKQYKTLRPNLPKDEKGEVKGRLLNEQQVDNTVSLLLADSALFEGRGHLGESLRNIVATSAISHGVDVDKFNAMFFAGLPSDIAEYIQASSRVGRTHVGFSLLVPTPHSRRDRYVIETHDQFHRFLERMIPPPAVQRWAERAIRRAMPSILQAYLCGLVEQEIFAASGADKVTARDGSEVGEGGRTPSLWYFRLRRQFALHSGSPKLSPRRIYKFEFR